MANIMFKRGVQENLNKLTAAEDGVFYLTTDTNRLYVGGTAANGDKGFKLLNSIVNIVDNLATLQATSANWTTNDAKLAHKNDFYYVAASNILCVWAKRTNDSNWEWVQINPDHNDNYTNVSLTNTVTTTSNTSTVKTEV